MINDIQRVLKATHQTPADYTFFETWFHANKQMKSADKTRIVRLTDFNVQQLYAEFTTVLIQPSAVLNSAHLDETAYLALGDNQSYIPKSKKEKRQFVYACFIKYLASIEKAGRYEPSLYYFDLACSIDKINLFTSVHDANNNHHNQDDDEQPQNTSPFAILQKDILVLDEIQQIPLALLHVFLRLRPRSLYLLGDPHQLMGAQAPRLIAPLIEALQHHCYQPQIYKLEENFLNALMIGDVANVLLYAENQLFGTSEREATFFVNCSHSPMKGTLICEPDDPAHARPEKGCHHSVIIVPDNMLIDSTLW